MKTGPKPVDPHIRFWAKVDKSGECWIWTAGRLPSGYGEFYVGEYRTTANRVALGWAIGRRLEKGEEACHRCDNPPCVRPSHLFLGSAADNTADMWAKGRGRAPTMTHEMRAKVSAGLRATYAKGYQQAGTKKTHCPQGHPYDATNTRIDLYGHRVCRICERAKAARSNRKRRAA